MSIDDDVKAHNEKVLNNLKRGELVEKFALSIGCNEGQAATISKAYSDRFVYDGAVLSFNDKPVVEAQADVVEHFKTQGLDFLLPVKVADGKSDVDAALIAAARTSKTAEGQLFRKLHGDKPKSAIAETQAALAMLLAEKPKAADDDKTPDPAFKGKSNPWRPEFWSVTEQGRIVKTLGVAVAQRMAEAAHSRLGATHPSKAA